MENGWILDHVGHAVNNLDAAVAKYSELFGFKLELREIVEESGVEVAFMALENSSIELLAPLPGDSLLKKFLERNGEGIHHICFMVESVEKELEKLKSQGVELVDNVPRPGSRGTSIAFIHPKQTMGALIELCSKDV